MIYLGVFTAGMTRNEKNVVHETSRDLDYSSFSSKEDKIKFAVIYSVFVEALFCNDKNKIKQISNFVDGSNLYGKFSERVSQIRNKTDRERIEKTVADAISRFPKSSRIKLEEEAVQSSSSSSSSQTQELGVLPEDASSSNEPSSTVTSANNYLELDREEEDEALLRLMGIHLGCRLSRYSSPYSSSSSSQSMAFPGLSAAISSNDETPVTATSANERPLPTQEELDRAVLSLRSMGCGGGFDLPSSSSSSARAVPAAPAAAGDYGFEAGLGVSQDTNNSMASPSSSLELQGMDTASETGSTASSSTRAQGMDTASETGSTASSSTGAQEQVKATKASTTASSVNLATLPAVRPKDSKKPS